MAEAITSNAIPTLQIDEPQLKIMRAPARIYGLASRILVAQLILTLLIPALGTVHSVRVCVHRRATVGNQCYRGQCPGAFVFLFYSNLV